MGVGTSMTTAEMTHDTPDLPRAADGQAGGTEAAGRLSAPDLTTQLAALLVAAPNVLHRARILPREAQEIAEAIVAGLGL